MIEQKDVDRFWQKVEITGKGNCWNWTASNSGGYGAFRFRGKYGKRIDSVGCYIMGSFLMEYVSVIIVTIKVA